MAHFIVFFFFLRLVSLTPGNFSSLLMLLCLPLPPPPPPAVHRLFTIHVLNKNEVRKWFQGYRSCKTPTDSVKERGTKKKCVHLFKKEGFTQLLHLWLQSELNRFHSLAALIDFHRGFLILCRCAFVRVVGANLVFESHPIWFKPRP